MEGLELTLDDFIGFVKSTFALLLLGEEHVFGYVRQKLCDEDVVHEFEQSRLHLI